jgi:hypothetical protein
MDVQLLALIALIIAVVIAATRQHTARGRDRAGSVFSVGFAGLLFFIAGVIGWPSD